MRVRKWTRDSSFSLRASRNGHHLAHRISGARFLLSVPRYGHLEWLATDGRGIRILFLALVSLINVCWPSISNATNGCEPWVAKIVSAQGRVEAKRTIQITNKPHQEMSDEELMQKTYNDAFDESDWVETGKKAA